MQRRSISDGDMTSPIILWLRRDLRLADHSALHAAVEADAPVVPVFVLDEASDGAWPPGGASRWWLHMSLSHHARRLAAIGGRLVLRRGDTLAHLRDIAAATGSRTVHVTRGYEPADIRLETRVRDALATEGIELKRFAGAVLREPEAVRTQAGEPFRVFTPFWRALSGHWSPARVLPAPGKLEPTRRKVTGDALDDWQLLPRKPDWAAGLRAAWSPGPGEEAAEERLARFVSGPMATYSSERDRPDREGTSRLSPHLHFGEISIRRCWHAAAHAAERDPAMAAGAGTFLRELAWREFSRHLLFHFPELPEAPFRGEFTAFPWSSDVETLRLWQKGLTGYPIVDAGIRELWQTGWMHNRVRMIVASFLVKHLLIPWQDGEAWFWDTLVDADLANNAASWQWVAGSGADAAPYFRIFNPMIQGARFDPRGDYVRRYVPELARLPAEHIHAPWLAPEKHLAQAGVVLGSSYPLPIVDHAHARSRALAAFKELKAR